MRSRWLLVLCVAAACGRSGFDPAPRADAPAPPADAAVDGTLALGAVTAVAAGGAHTCAILTGGRVRCWGSNTAGQLGRGNLVSIGDDETPASAGDVELGGPALQIAAGALHTCAILDGGRVRCWGAPGGGRLGYGNLTAIGDDEVPSVAGDVNVGGVATQIGAGGTHTCALLATGSVRCWGDNFDGQLGQGNVVDVGDDETPASVPAIELGGLATQIAVGDAFTCALLATGSVRCWGANGHGQLGYGNTNQIGDGETPASAGDVDLGGVATQIAAGEHHACARLATGAVRCWGEGIDGRLGHASTDAIGDNETPASPGDIDLGGAAQAVVAGRTHTCALLASGAVRCWGNAEQGRLGYADLRSVGDDETPASAGDVAIGAPVEQLSAGALHTCALGNGHLRCWGSAAQGRLGYGKATLVIGDDEPPASVPTIALGVPATKISAGAEHTCALLTGGSVACWGSNASGQLGNPERDFIGDDETPARAGTITLGGPAIDLEVGGEHACAILMGGAVRCWGSGSSGRLGYGNSTTIGDRETPAAAGDVTVGASATGLSLGTNHTCVIVTGGAVRCWGNNAFGQLGYGNLNNVGDNETPASAGAVMIGGTVTQLALGDGHGCALLSTGAVRCWGESSTGELGYHNILTIGDDETPASAGDVPLSGKATQLSFGGEHVCAVLAGGNVQCWGDGSDGRLGYGNEVSIGNNETPASAGLVAVGASVAKVAAGDKHTCALLTDGRVRCWGLGSGGRLGYGNTTSIGDNESPAVAGDVDLGGLAMDIAAGDHHTCVIMATTGAVRCWGDDAGLGILGQAIANDVGDTESPASAGDVPVE